MLAALGFLGGQAAALALATLTATLLGQRKELSSLAGLDIPPQWYVLCSLLGLWLGFLGAATVAARLGGGPGLLASFGIGLRLADARYILVGVLAQLGVGLLYLPFLDHLSNFDAPTRRLTGASHGPGIAVIVVATALAAPVVEEIFFRGLILRGLLAVAGRGRAVVGALGATVCVLLDGAIFAAAHAEGLQFAGLMALGCLLAFMTLRAERVGPAIVTHVSFNAVALAFAFGSG